MTVSGASARAGERSWAALGAFTREPGRSVAARIEGDRGHWRGGIEADVARPAASLLKLPLAVAAERARAEGRLDGRARLLAGDLLRGGDQPSVLGLLRPDHELTVDEVLALTVGASDGPCARWLLGQVGVGAVRAAVRAAGCERTLVDAGPPGDPLVGVTTADDALLLLAAALDPVACPVASAALRRSIRNSRIPLGASSDDVVVAHKTGTLHGVAHDVAVVTCRTGTAQLAFLADAQHDTLVTGYEMGICTRDLLQAWGLSVVGTTSAVEG